MPPSKVGILVPAGMLGAGFDPATVERGLTLNPHVIAVHGGSTDSGPHYLGTGTARTTAAAVARDLRILLDAAARAGIPLVIGSCGTSGTDSGVDRVAGTAEEILPETGLDPRIARICSEQDPSFLEEQLAAGRVRPLPPVGPLDVSDAVHTALDERRVRVEGSRFEPAHPHTIKAEGARHRRRDRVVRRHPRPVHRGPHRPVGRDAAHHPGRVRRADPRAVRGRLRPRRPPVRAQRDPRGHRARLRPAVALRARSAG